MGACMIRYSGSVLVLLVALVMHPSTVSARVFSSCKVPSMKLPSTVNPSFVIMNLTDTLCRQAAASCPETSECTYERTEMASCVPRKVSEFQELWEESLEKYRGDVAILKNVIQTSQAHVFVPHSSKSVMLMVPGGCTHRCPLQLHGSPTMCLERAATTVFPFGSNFFHWIVDVLPRLMQLTPFLQQDTTLPLLVNSRQLMYLAEFLLPKEVDWHERTLSLSRRMVYLQSLVVPLSPVCSESVHPGAKWLRQRYLSVLMPTVQPKRAASDSRFITAFVSRLKTRAVSNEGELISSLGNVSLVWKFESMAASNFKGILRQLSISDVLMGPHGAGLTTLLFLPPGATVVELRPAKHSNRYGIGSYDQLAPLSGLKIHVVTCAGSFYGQLVADVGKVVDLVSTIHAERRA
eukprot:NODE_1593_length_1479_cov_5.977622_g1437_i0.p1 GENE.NODE_1593_length_1479_cov_5.977622_g1437_i0~~NODE_1593_length_1479_cov_5.977622_g1437_i0.p1  ORF type:complete len:407 (+),score=54.68 NODE_1593_length_1479_cov_5.977622_g1437_i0:141-1361(+)